MTVSINDYVKQIVPHFTPAKTTGQGIAPANIALVKYWGKRDLELNLPLTSSLSISLANHGSTTRVSEESFAQHDLVFLNDELVACESDFYKRVQSFLDLFRPHPNYYFRIDTTNNIPTASGLASSASGYAAIVLALNNFFQWQLDDRKLSLLARIGSGSACRSLWHGFVLWQQGEAADGLDSYAHPLATTWPSIRVAIVVNDFTAKALSSREAMVRTMHTSPFAALWPECVARDLRTTQEAIAAQDIRLLGATAENNAEAMHALMLSARPAINYGNELTLQAKAKVLALRTQGVPVYYTQDAGAHLKLLFEEPHEAAVKEHFSGAEVVRPFAGG